MNPIWDGCPRCAAAGESFRCVREESQRSDQTGEITSVRRTWRCGGCGYEYLAPRSTSEPFDTLEEARGER